MVKKYLLAIVTMLLLASSTFAATYTTVYTDNCCVEKETFTADAKFDKVFEEKVMYQKTEILKTCEYEGDCGCTDCETTKIKSPSRFTWYPNFDFGFKRFMDSWFYEDTETNCYVE